MLKMEANLRNYSRRQFLFFINCKQNDHHCCDADMSLFYFFIFFELNIKLMTKRKRPSCVSFLIFLYQLLLLFYTNFSKFCCKKKKKKKLLKIYKNFYLVTNQYCILSPILISPLLCIKVSLFLVFLSSNFAKRTDGSAVSPWRLLFLSLHIIYTAAWNIYFIRNNCIFPLVKSLIILNKYSHRTVWTLFYYHRTTDICKE